MSIRGQVSAAVRGARVAAGMRRYIRASDSTARDRASRELCRLFASSRGVPAKLGQWLGVRGHGEEFEALGDGVDPMPFDVVADLVESRLGQPIDQLFREFSETGHGASFGQVHQAQTHEGQSVAVKIRYPGIEDALESELSLLKLIPRLGPFKATSMNLESLRDTLGQALTAELDYGREARDQVDYGRSCAIPGLVVPTIVPELCTDGILTQTWEPGVPLEEVAKDWPTSDKAKVGEILARHFLRRFFVDGIVHADPHTGNYRFRRDAHGNPEVVLLDYGSLAAIPKAHSNAFLRLLLATRRAERIDPVECFAMAGFEREKLTSIAHLLPALARTLFEPFLVDQPLRASEWLPGQRIRQLLGDSTWWFRSAAPPELILGLRAFAGLLAQIDALGIRVFWHRCMEQECCGALLDAEKVELPPATDRATTCADMAQNLRVKLWVDGKERVAVSFPARVVDNLPDLLEKDTIANIEAHGTDLEEVTQAARKRGYQRGTVFEFEDDSQRILVELY